MFRHAERLLRPSVLITFIAGFALLMASTGALAASPDLRLVTPRGGQRGTEVQVQLRGKRLNDAKELLIYEPGLTVTKLANDEKKGNDVVHATIKIAPDARLGEYHVRLRTATGVTDLDTFWVGPLATVNEKEPNTDFDKPQAIEVDTTVEGTVENEDIDYFAVKLKKGQRLSAEVEGIRLGGVLFDPAVAILDANRFELAGSDDTALLNQDCYASIIAPEDGTYVVAVREAAYGGSGNHRYRVHIGEFPRPVSVFPMGGQAGQEVTFRFVGDPRGDFTKTVKLPGEATDRFELIAEQDGKTAPSPNIIRVSPFPNVLEKEPNNGLQDATAHSGGAPVAFNGILQEPGDIDCFKLTLKKGERPVFRAYSRSLGSRVDPVLNVYRAKDNKHQKGNDDSAGRLDSSVDGWSAPEDGEYIVRITDHLSNGGPTYTYRIEVATPDRDLTLGIPEVARDDTQSRQWIAAPKGNRWMTLIRARRNGVGGDLKLVAENLPPGLTMHAPIMRNGVSDVPVVFEAAPDAKLEGALVDLKARPVDEKSKEEGRYIQEVMLVSGPPNRTPYYTSTVERITAAVCEEAPFKLRIEEPKVPLVQSGAMNLKIIAEKKEGWDEEIRVIMPFRPPGLSARSQIVIPKGKTEATYPINAKGNAMTGDWDIAVTGYGNVNGQLWVGSPLTKLTIGPALVRGEIQMAVTEQGKPADVLVKLNQLESFEGKATLKLLGLPNEATAPDIEITKETEEVIFKVTTTEKTPTGQHKSLLIQLQLPQNGDTIVQTVAGGGVLRVDKPRPKVAEAPKKEEKKEAKKEKKAEPAPKPLSRLEQLRLEREKANN